MAVYAAVASLMNTIDQIMNHPRLSACLDTQQIQPLLDTASSLLDFTEGYSHGGLTSKEVEDLERRIACAAHAAEDVIESNIVNQIRARTNVASLRFLFRMQQMVEEMDAILEKTNELKDKAGLRLREDEDEDEQPTHSRIPLMDQTRETTMVGFEDELIQIMDVLTNQQSSRQVISIVGMGGSGKTTLARNLYQNSLIKHHFDIRAWATISQQHNVRDILSQLLSRQEYPSQRSDALGEELYKSLSGRRYLIILDDVWSVEAWDEVRHFFPDNGNRNRVVLTTRLSNVARDCLSSSCFSMKPLDEHISWKLFCRKAFEQETCPYPELEEVGKEIVRLCRGLPLSTDVIGGLNLRSPRTLEFLDNLARNIRSNPGSEEKQESLDILSLSYHHLPPHLKPCFLYMGAFKEDYEIRVSKVIKFWVAEGFIRPKNNHILEEVANGYLKELIDRNLILVRKHRKNGKIGSCGIHDLVRDLCLKVGEQQEFFRVIESKKKMSITERKWPRQELLDALSHASSFLNYDLHRFWDVGEGEEVESSTDIYENVKLRCLSCNYFIYEHPFFGNLPSAICLVWNLQTLAVEAEFVAPTEIWSMRQLRHVQCDRIYLPDPPSGSSFMMDNLQTLTTALNFRLSEQVCGIIPNVKKVHLLYDDGTDTYDSSVEYMSNLACLENLKSLKITYTGRVYLMMKFPVSLSKLSLCDCMLECEDMWMIGSLPRLEVLCLDSCRVDGEWSLVEGQFLRLKYLKLEHLILRDWCAESSHFPVLKELVLKFVWGMEEIPSGVGEIPTLEYMCVNCCGESAAISAVKMKEDQLQMGNDGLQIQVVLLDTELESFKVRMKREGLKVDHVQLKKLY